MKRTLFTLFLGAVLGVLCSVPASTQKEEVAKKEPAPTVQAQVTMKEVMLQYLGKAPNLGTIKKVTGEYFTLEQEGATVIHPLSVIHTIETMKDEETGETKIEIILVAKD